MTVPRTSAVVYERIVNNGLLGEMQEQFYVFLHGFPEGLTRGEIKQNLKQKAADPDWATEPWINRLYELMEKAVVDVVGERICTVTGNNCQVYATNDKEPQPFVRAESLDREEFQVAISELEALMPPSPSPELTKLFAWVKYKASLAKDKVYQ